MASRHLTVFDYFPGNDRIDSKTLKLQIIRDYTDARGMRYYRDDDAHCADFGEPPVVVNYFFHEEVKKSAKTKG